MEIAISLSLITGFLLAYFLREREIAYLKTQNAELRGSVWQRIGYKPEAIARKKSKNALPPEETPDRYAEDVPDVKDRQEAAVKQSESMYGNYTPDQWMKLSPKTQARFLSQQNKEAFQEMEDERGSVS